MSLLKEAELFDQVYIPMCLGLLIRFDGTKMRLFQLNQPVKSSEIIVRSLCAISKTGSRHFASPILVRLCFLT